MPVVAATAALLAWPAAALELEPCRIAGTGGLHTVAAECGHLVVPENRDEPGGATLELFVARVPALDRAAESAAFTIIAGGPGQSSAEFYVNSSRGFSRVNRERDIVLVDQRGTGRSNAMRCPMPDDGEPLSLDPELLREATEACLEQLPGDPRFYSTSPAVRDLDAVRAALGYERLDLYGVSYGTRVAQHYLRRFPSRTRTVVLDGVVPADMPLGPGISLDAQAALDSVFDRCAAQPACAARFDDLRTGFAGLLDEFGTEAMIVTMPDPVTGELGEVPVTATELKSAVRLLSYHTDTVSLLPLLLHEAYAGGNIVPLAAQAKLSARGIADALAMGMHNAVVCAEDVPFFPDDLDRDAIERSYLGMLQVDGLVEICSLWPTAVIDEDFKAPVVSDKPVLLLSGDVDPVTPAAYGDRIVPTLPNAVHIINEGQGHGQALLGCMPRLIAEFVTTADAKALDTSCTERLRPAPFFLDFTGPAP